MAPGPSSYKYEVLSSTENDDAVSDAVTLSTGERALTSLQGDVEDYEMQGSWSESQQLHDIDGIHDGLVCPTNEQRETLRRVADDVPWSAYLIALVELAERFSTYGAGVVFTNFIQYPLPVGSHTGAGLRTGQSGALGKGQRASTGISTLYQLWCLIVPFLGAYIADVHLGRFKTVCIAAAIALVGHAILIFSAIPGIIEHPDTSFIIFILALVIMGFGTGLFKANISPLVAEQYKRTKLFVRTTDSGETVIVDPSLTVSRIYMYFYLVVNVGALIGQVSMTYAEKYVGFWLAYTLPTAVFLLCPLVLFAGRRRYTRTPPTGSVLATCVRLVRFAARGRWSANPLRTWRRFAADDFLDAAKPGRIARARRPPWMTFDDAWVDEVARALKACAVLAWFPIYWLASGQMNTNLISQAATMTTNGLPNDILSNINPLVLIVCIPLCDFFLYPALQRRAIRFTSLKRIAAGFLVASAAMVWAAILQHFIYQTNPCHHAAATCRDAAQQPLVSPISVWVQSSAYALLAVSEILASITGLEYAFTKAPANMRSLVMALYTGTGAVSAALAQAFLWLSADPMLVWNYAVMATLVGGGGCAFWLSVRRLDAQEDALNALTAGQVGKDVDVDSESEDA